MPKGQRSRAYPLLSLAEAGEVSRRIRSELGAGEASRETLGGMLGYTSTSGGLAARKIASLVHFGLLERAGGRYQLSRLGERLATTEGAEQRAARMEAFLHPRLFRGLVERFEPQGRLPRDLAKILSRDFEISAAAAEPAAEVFRNSAVTAGVLSQDGRFVRGEREVEPSVETVEAVLAPPSPTLLAMDDGEQRFEIALSGGRLARMVFPKVLTRRDLEILRRQIEILGLQVGTSD